MDPHYIRNFCIIAHIDHGKSTLADRFLEATGTVTPQDMVEQFLDQMELERERGITIKGKAVTMTYRGGDGLEYQLNLIDTPGHVDFSYEVSRALAACEGALLVVDASQGIEAQTIANAFLAIENDLVLIPVVNKVDLPQAEPETVAAELQQVFGFSPEEVMFTSAKDGSGVLETLQAVIDRVPPPRGEPDAPLRALVFDSIYNAYKGIVAYVRVFDGSITKDGRVLVMSTGKVTESMEMGVFSPHPTPIGSLTAGQVGYIATGLKDVRECGVGETLTLVDAPAKEPLTGYVPLKPMVFAGLYPSDGEDYQSLRAALEKLQLNDAALVYDPENSPALGFGFRCGFLGLLHMDIVQERLEREYGLNIVVTAPSVAYRVDLKDGTSIELDTPSRLPSPNDIQEIREPWLAATVVTPNRHVGAVMELMSARRGEFKRMEYIQGSANGQDDGPGGARVLMEYGPAHVGDAGRLLQPAQVPHPGLCLAGLFSGGLPQRAPGETGHIAQSGARGRPVHDRAQGQGISVRPGPGGAPEVGHTSPDVRSAHPGDGGEPDHSPGDRPGDEEGCPGQVLRWRRDPQAQAAGETERRQEAPQTGRPGGDTPGGLPGAAQGGGLAIG